MRRLAILFGLLAIIMFAAYYQYAYTHWPEIPQIYYDATNWLIWTTLSVTFFTIGRAERNIKLKYLVFYNFGFFWLYLVIAYLLNEINDLAVPMHKVFISLLLTLLTGLLCYLLSTRYYRSVHGG